MPSHCRSRSRSRSRAAAGWSRKAIKKLDEVNVRDEQLTDNPVPEETPERIRIDKAWLDAIGHWISRFRVTRGEAMMLQMWCNNHLLVRDQSAYIANRALFDAWITLFQENPDGLHRLYREIPESVVNVIDTNDRFWPDSD